MSKHKALIQRALRAALAGTPLQLEKYQYGTWLPVRIDSDTLMPDTQWFESVPHRVAGSAEIRLSIEMPVFEPEEGQMVYKMFGNYGFAWKDPNDAMIQMAAQGLLFASGDAAIAAAAAWIEALAELRPKPPAPIPQPEPVAELPEGPEVNDPEERKDE